jgi:ABC-type Fe3+ transport system substrate-binding protein
MSTVAALGTVLLSSAGPGAAEIGTTEAELYENAKAEGSIVWYEAAPLEPMQALASRFEAKYPGVKVQLLRTSGPQQYQKFMQETMAGQYIADMLLLSDAPLMKQLIADGHIAEWKIPTADRYPASFRMGDYAFAPYTTDIAIVYNTNLVSEEEAQILGSSWKGVLDPRFKGRFANVKRKCGTCYAGIHMFLDPAMADEYGPDFLQAVADQKPTLYADNPVALDRVVAGEHDFVFWLWEAIAITKHAEGAPIRWVRPSPTPEFGNSWQAISAHAPHPNAARLFHNWLLSEEGEISLQETYGARTTMEDLEDTRPATKEPWYQPIETRYDIDWDRWASDYQKDMTLWQSIQDTANQ